MKHLASVLALSLVSCVPAAYVVTHDAYETDVAPPPAQVEVMTPAPSTAHVWVPGVWAWRGRRYVWTPGRWVAGRPGYGYRQGGWVLRGRRHVWVHGGWYRY